MDILCVKPGHDASVALLSDGKLVFAVEGEKDSYPRHEAVTANLIVTALERTPTPPDVICVSGWVKGFHSVEKKLESGYYGHDESAVITRTTRVFGRDTLFFTSTHERSHLLGSYGMSPYPQGRPCYALIWEGNIGAFYEIDERLKITKFPEVMKDPGNKYAFLFGLADPTYDGRFRFADAGKLMALAAFSDRGSLSAAEAQTSDYILDNYLLWGANKIDYSWSPYFNIGVQDPAFKQLAGKFSDALFGRFLSFARRHLIKGHPLVIGGGCGLNCEWNTRWRESGLFPDVFVPPCANDAGSAIGTALDAQWHFTGKAKLEWNVYCGEEFHKDVDESAVSGWVAECLNLPLVARRLAEGCAIAWVDGRWELGPRALGNRSLLASPFDQEMHQRLNAIKQRESYRPIAPVCTLEDAPEYFDGPLPSPHMLYFQKVKANCLKAVTHVDGSARAQTVTAAQNLLLHRLLLEFKEITGYAVLCNTSLNFKGRGFINRLSDLVEYCMERGLDGFVVGGRMYWKATGGR